MGIVRMQWKNLLHPIAVLENGTFYLISRDHNQPIKRPEFNDVLYKIYSIIGTVYIVK